MKLADREVHVAQEIERKFLVRGDDYRALGTCEHYRQGYLRRAGPSTVRVRIAGERAYLTIKGPTEGLRRSEFEYPIPLADAEELLETLCDRPQIEKRRYLVKHGDHTWEVDEFLGDNAGLVMAEIELDREDERFEMPAWVGEEVTQDPRYRNAALAMRPYKSW
jgi:CYTH domain-containing protein